MAPSTTAATAASQKRAPGALNEKQRLQLRNRDASDRLLGCFSNVPPSETLDHLIRYLSTWSGTDKVLMLTQYSSKLLVAVLELQHSLRLRLALAAARTSGKPYRGGGRGASGGATVQRLKRLGSLISDARTLYRIWSVLPILKWMIALERSPPPTRLLHQIERIQGWSMLVYCPLEALAYLASHAVVPLAESTQASFWLWSSRAWAVYVACQLLHLVEDNRLLRLRARALERSRGHPMPLPASHAEAAASAPAVPGTADDGGVQGYRLDAGDRAAEKDEAASRRRVDRPLSEEQLETRRMWDELDDRKDAILNELVANLSYMPLTLHWSHAKGFLGEATVGLLGTVAGLAGLRNGWKATAERRA